MTMPRVRPRRPGDWDVAESMAVTSVSEGSVELRLGGGHVGPAAPHVDGVRLAGVEGPRAPGLFVGDPPDAPRVLVGEALGTLEVEEDGADQTQRNATPGRDRGHARKPLGEVHVCPASIR